MKVLNFAGRFNSYEDLKLSFPSSDVNLVALVSSNNYHFKLFFYDVDINDWYCPLSNSIPFAFRNEPRITGREQGVPLNGDILSYDFFSKIFKPFTKSELDLASDSLLKFFINNPLNYSVKSGRIVLDELTPSDLQSRNELGIKNDSHLVSFSFIDALLYQINKDYSRKISIDYDSKGRPYVVRENLDKVIKNDVEVYTSDYDNDSLINFNIDRPTFEKFIERINKDYSYLSKYVKKLSSIDTLIEDEVPVYSGISIPFFPEYTPISSKTSFKKFELGETLVGIAMPSETSEGSVLYKNLEILPYKNSFVSGTPLYLSSDCKFVETKTSVLLGYVINEKELMLNFQQDTVVIPHNKTVFKLSPGRVYEICLEEFNLYSCSFVDNTNFMLSDFKIFKHSVPVVKTVFVENILGYFSYTVDNKLLYSPSSEQTLYIDSYININTFDDLSHFQIKE